MDVLGIMSRPQSNGRERVNPDTVTVIKGPSFGVGPVLTVVHRDGATWTAMPNRRTGWTVIDRETREKRGSIMLRKVRGEQSWEMVIQELAGTYRGCKHLKCMYPVVQDANGVVSRCRMPSRDEAIRVALACLLVGQDRAGVNPVIDWEWRDAQAS